MPELCKSCQTPMTVAKNKNGGYFATCPNKANHAGAKTAGEPPKAKAKAEAPPAAAPPPAPKPATGRTVFGW